MKYIWYNPTTKEIASARECPDSLPEMASAGKPIDHEVLVVNTNVNSETHYVENGTLVEYTPAAKTTKSNRPGKDFIWSNQSLSWVDQRDLQGVKDAKRAEVNLWRAIANQSKFVYLGKEIACDKLSRSDIDAVNGEITLTNNYPADWPGGWKCMDNTYIPLSTKADWIAFYQAMTAQGTANFIHAQTLKAQVEAATTVAQVEAITW